MKILHLSAVKNWGGGENHIENLCLELRKHAPETENMILCVKDGKFHHKLKKSQLPFITAPLGIKVDLRFVWKIVAVCRKSKIDLIHIHDPSALALAIIADKFFDLPPFVFSKKTSFPIKDRKQTLFKYNYPKIKRILCVSEETRRIASEQIADINKLVTIYHGTRLDNKSDVTPFLLRDHLNISEDKKIIGSIGNHIRAKHLETLIQTAHQIINIEKRTDLVFVQMGDFTDRTAALQQTAAALNLQDHLFFLGFTPNASNFLPQFNALLVTSQSEGIPQVIFEAFYHKTPVVSTKVGGIPEIIQHEYNGLLSEKWDSGFLAKNVIRLMDDPQEAAAYTERSLEVLMEGFSTTKMASETLREYKSLILEEKEKLKISLS